MKALFEALTGEMCQRDKISVFGVRGFADQFHDVNDEPIPQIQSNQLKRFFNEDIFNGMNGEPKVDDERY